MLIELLKKAAGLVVICLLSATCAAQTARSSQYFASPLTLNPALTGQLEGNFRVAAQVPSLMESFNTMSISIDAPVLKGLAENDEWGIGFLGMSGRAGNNAMSSSNFSFSTSYMKGLDDKGWKQVGIGIQAAYQKNSLSKSPYQQEGINPYLGMPIPQELMKTTADPANLDYPAFLDLSAGALFTGSNNGQNNYYLGLSAFHLNAPNITVNGKKQYSIQPEYILHGGFSYPILEGRRTLYVSSFLSKQDNITTISAGGVIGGFGTANGRQFHLGGWAKYNSYYRAVIPYVSIEHKSLQLACSYNILFSVADQTAPIKKGAEISLIYIRNSRKEEERKPRPRY